MTYRQLLDHRINPEKPGAFQVLFNVRSIMKTVHFRRQTTDWRVYSSVFKTFRRLTSFEFISSRKLPRNKSLLPDDRRWVLFSLIKPPFIAFQKRPLPAYLKVKYIDRVRHHIIFAIKFLCMGEAAKSCNPPKLERHPKSYPAWSKQNKKRNRLILPRSGHKNRTYQKPNKSIVLSFTTFLHKRDSTQQRNFYNYCKLFL